MTRWDPGDKRQMLQAIADDERRPLREREAARRELNTNQPGPTSPRRHERNANVPQTQADEDSDLEQALVFRPNDGLTTQDRIEIQCGLPELTRALIDAIQNNRMLWLFTNNLADVPLLIDLASRTQSEFVRNKSLDALRLIAARSPIESAKTEAQQFLDQAEQRRKDN